MKKMFCSLFLMAAVNGFTLDVGSTTHIECSIDRFERAGASKAIAPFVQVQESTSSNWSGYVSAHSLETEAAGSVTVVSGSWVVPSLVGTQDDTYSALWVGIDGYLNGTVEQIGTSHNWVGGVQQNYAWFEMYPQGSFQITGFPVYKGDHITAEVQYSGNNVFTLTLMNNTKGVHTVIPSAYTTSASAKRSSAEWIVEAPATSSGILPLADFGATTIRLCNATINGVSGTVSNKNWEYDTINMETNGVIKAKTSALINYGYRFNVNWEHE